MDTMRDIRFRAWIKAEDHPDGYKPEMLYDIQDIHDNPIGKQGMYYESFSEVLNDPNAIVMQYTGLKDKNGKEIYEGDIVSHSWVEGSKGSVSGHIVYEAPSFKNEFRGQRRFMNPEVDYEVIGNIYENAELLYQ